MDFLQQQGIQVKVIPGMELLKDSCIAIFINLECSADLGGINSETNVKLFVALPLCLVMASATSDNIFGFLAPSWKLVVSSICADC